MRDAIPHIAVVLTFLIAVAVLWLMTPKPMNKTREQLRRELEEAERAHAKRKHIRKLYVQATCEELRR